jgi:hypothetical protein
MLTLSDKEEMKRRLETSQRLVEDHYDQGLQRMKVACDVLDEEECKNILSELLRCSKVRGNLGFCLAKVNSEVLNKKQTYVVGSLFLRECFGLLVRERAKKNIEVLYYVTGIDIGGVLVLDKILAPDLSTQSGSYVSAEQSSSNQIFMELEDYGHGLHGWLHNHIGTGAFATSPSEIDLTTQERLEGGGYRAIGGIFSEDGFLRFFSKNSEFNVVVFGKGVKRIDDYLFKIEEI